MSTREFDLVPIGIRMLQLEGAVDITEQPATEVMWKILGGKITHVTGTATAVYIQKIHTGTSVVPQDLEAMIAAIAADFSNGDFPLFVNANEFVAATNIPSVTGVTGEHWVDHEHVIRSQGAAGLIVQVMVMEYKVKKK